MFLHSAVYEVEHVLLSRKGFWWRPLQALRLLDPPMQVDLSAAADINAPLPPLHWYFWHQKLSRCFKHLYFQLYLHQKSGAGFIEELQAVIVSMTSGWRILQRAFRSVYKSCLCELSSQAVYQSANCYSTAAWSDCYESQLLDIQGDYAARSSWASFFLQTTNPLYTLLRAHAYCKRIYSSWRQLCRRAE